MQRIKGSVIKIGAFPFKDDTGGCEGHKALR